MLFANFMYLVLHSNKSFHTFALSQWTIEQ